jgi:hypothetical protein
MEAGNTKLIIASTSSGAEEIAEKVPKSRAVVAELYQRSRALT